LTNFNQERAPLVSVEQILTKKNNINQYQLKDIININIFELLTIFWYLNNFLHLVVIEIFNLNDKNLN